MQNPTATETGLMAVRFILLCLVGLTVGTTGCHPAQGACLVGSGITRSCGEDYTGGQCSIINGTFYEGASCADLRVEPTNRFR